MLVFLQSGVTNFVVEYFLFGPFLVCGPDVVLFFFGFCLCVVLFFFCLGFKLSCRMCGFVVARLF